MLRKYILLCCYGSLPKNKLLSPHKSGPLKTQAPPPQFPAKQQFQKNLHSWGGGGAVGGGAGVVEGVVVLDQKQRVEEKKIFGLT